MLLWHKNSMQYFYEVKIQHDLFILAKKRWFIIHCVRNTWFGKTKKYNRNSWICQKNDLDE